jgi:hypothetical protein
MGRAWHCDASLGHTISVLWTFVDETGVLRAILQQEAASRDEIVDKLPPSSQPSSQRERDSTTMSGFVTKLRGRLRRRSALQQDVAQLCAQRGALQQDVMQVCTQRAPFSIMSCSWRAKRTRCAVGVQTVYISRKRSRAAKCMRLSCLDSTML